MDINKKKFLICLVLAIVWFLSVFSFAQNQRQRPPEYDLYRKAVRISDLNARIEALEKVKNQFPQSRYLSSIESAIVHAEIGLSDTLEGVLKLQKSLIHAQKG